MVPALRALNRIERVVSRTPLAAATARTAALGIQAPIRILLCRVVVLSLWILIICHGGVILGVLGLFAPRVAALWIPAYAGMTGPVWLVSCFTLTFDSSAIKGEGCMVVLYCCQPGAAPLD